MIARADNSPRTELTTALPLDKCLARLRESTDAPSKMFGAKPVIASISGASAKLRKRLTYRTSFQPILSVAFSEKNGKTHLQCCSGFHWGIMVALALWCGSVVVDLVTAIGGAHPHAADIVFPAFMLFFVAMLAIVGLRKGRSDTHFMIDFLCQTLDARDSSNKKSPFAPKEN